MLQLNCIPVMAKETKREVWQRGPVENIPALLQPVAHALLQAREEVDEMMKDFPEEFLWQHPAGAASAGFHLQHLTGVIDRLFTYARGEGLTELQLQALSKEGKSAEDEGVTDLLGLFDKQVGTALHQLSATDPQTLTDQRVVGRAKIPSTVIGLLFHTAEHVMRHVGQLSVTTKVIKERFRNGL